jgi:acyl-CoA reductase-like NAD-dependent aldehyde dehydrogenase
VAAADVAEVNAAVESAHRAWETGWRDLPPGKLGQILCNVARKSSSTPLALGFSLSSWKLP